MFTRKSAPTTPGLDDAIDRLLTSMADVDPHSDDYKEMTERLQALHALKLAEKPARISPDTYALIAGNLVGIVLIVGYERSNIITSKALSFVLKTR